MNHHKKSSRIFATRLNAVDDDVIVNRIFLVNPVCSLQMSYTEQTPSKGRDPFNQNFRAEVRKFLGGKWIATGPKDLVPFQFRAHLK